MIEETRRQARLLRVVGILLSPSIYLLILYWNKSDESGLSKAVAVFLWFIPSAISILCFALSFGRSDAAKRLERRENLKLLAASEQAGAQEAARALNRSQKSDVIAGWIGVGLLMLGSIFILYFAVIIPSQSNYPVALRIFGIGIFATIAFLIALFIKRLIRHEE